MSLAAGTPRPWCRAGLSQEAHRGGGPEVLGSHPLPPPLLAALPHWGEHRPRELCGLGRRAVCAFSCVLTQAGTACEDRPMAPGGPSGSTPCPGRRESELFPEGARLVWRHPGHGGRRSTRLTPPVRRGRCSTRLTPPGRREMPTRLTASGAKAPQTTSCPEGHGPWAACDGGRADAGWSFRVGDSYCPG